MSFYINRKYPLISKTKHSAINQAKAISRAGVFAYFLSVILRFQHENANYPKINKRFSSFRTSLFAQYHIAGFEPAAILVIEKGSEPAKCQRQHFCFVDQPRGHESFGDETHWSFHLLDSRSYNTHPTHWQQLQRQVGLVSVPAEN